MIIVNPVHIDIWGTYISTPIIKPHYADIRVATSINNYSEIKDSIIVKHTIYSDNNIKIVEKEISGKIKSNKNNLFEATMTISNPKRWGLENPYLYRLKTEIFQF